MREGEEVPTLKEVLEAENMFGKNVVMIEIPCAEKQPLQFAGAEYIRVATKGDENMKCYTQVYVKNSYETAKVYCKAFNAEITCAFKNENNLNNKI